jgi:integrase
VRDQVRLYRRKDSKSWWCEYYDAEGRRIQRTTRQRDKRAAELIAKQWERDATDPAGARARAASLSDALKLLIDDRKEQAAAGRKATDTVTFYEQKAAQLTRVFEGGEDDYRPYPLAQLTAGEVDRYISQRRTEGRQVRAGTNDDGTPRYVIKRTSEATIAKELIALRAALKLARRRGIWQGDPAAVCPIAFAPDYKPRERFLESPQEAEHLLAVLSPDRAARVAFIIATSAEWGATERAERADLDLKAGRVLVRGTKRKTRWRTVPAVFELQRSLLPFALDHGAGSRGLLFTPWDTVRRDLAAACKRAGIARCSPNDLRRTFAHWMSQTGVPNEVIAPQMGHKDTRMLDRVYNQKTPDELEADVRRYAGLQPRAPEGDRNACVTTCAESGGKKGRLGNPTGRKPAKSLPRDGIEPSTRGFSVSVSTALRPRNPSSFDRYEQPTVTHTSQRVRRKGGRR